MRKNESLRKLGFCASILIVASGLGIAPISCGDKQAPSNSSSSNSNNGGGTGQPAISYTGAPFVFTLGTAISSQTPVNSGDAITGCSSSPTLSAGLNLSSACVLSGTPTAVAASASYTITSTNAGGSGPAVISITVNDVAPAISYGGSPFTFTSGAAITSRTPANTGGAITGCSPSPALPTGLALSSACVLSGTPTAVTASASYTITASNSGGTGNTSVTIKVMNGDLAVQVGANYGNIFKLKAADGTVIWGPVSQTHCEGIAVDQIDFGVYVGSTGNCGGGSGVYKFSGANGSLVWNTTGVMSCGTSGGYYIGTGGVAVDSSSGTPGVVFSESGYYGNIGKVSRTTGAQLWCNATNDVGRPTVNPTSGEIYAITNAGYSTLYANTAVGAQTTASSCEGLVEANPADGTWYRGGSSCGNTLYQMSTSILGATNWSMSLAGSISNFSSLALQPWSGGYIYVGSTTSSKIAVINPATQTVVTTFTTVVTPNYMAVNPAGGNIYISNGASDFVYAYSPTGTLLWTSPSLGAAAYDVAAPRNIVGGP